MHVSYIWFVIFEDYIVFIVITLCKFLFLSYFFAFFLLYCSCVSWFHWRIVFSLMKIIIIISRIKFQSLSWNIIFVIIDGERYRIYFLNIEGTTRRASVYVNYIRSNMVSNAKYNRDIISDRTNILCRSLRCLRCRMHN